LSAGKADGIGRFFRRPRQARTLADDDVSKTPSQGFGLRRFALKSLFWYNLKPKGLMRPKGKL
jgi:hypothetical protein